MVLGREAMRLGATAPHPPAALPGDSSLLRDPHEIGPWAGEWGLRPADEPRPPDPN